MNDPRTKQLIDYFWPQGDRLHTPQVYAILDCARDGQIEPAVRSSKLETLCLFGGDLSSRLQAAAPQLVHLTPSASLTQNLLGKHWTDSWGIFVIVDPELTIQQLRRHFRKFLRVQDEKGNRLAFRFYDPRVLHVYLPTCTRMELEFLFGNINRYVMANQEGDKLLEHSMSLAGMRSKSLSLTPPSEPNPDLNVVVKSDAIKDTLSPRSSKTLTS